MPTAPKIPQRERGVRVQEILFGCKTEDLSQADGHIAVAGKIEIDLQAVAHSADPGKADIRRIIAEHKAFNGILRSYHFKKDVQVFASRFYVFGREGYPSCVDDYAEKQLGSEKYNCEEYKNEAYLFVPYDEKYYKGLSKYIEKEWKKFNR